MKNIIYLLTLIFLMNTTAYAMSNPDTIISGSAIDTVTSSSAVENNTTEVEILYIEDTDFNKINFYPQYSEITDLTLPETTYIQIGSRNFLECNINWNSITTIDTSILGLTTLKGTVEEPTGYKFKGGLSPEIAMPIFIYTENMDIMEYATITSIDNYCELIPLGSNPLDYINTNNKYYLKTESGYYFLTTATWDYCDIPQEQGKITVTGSFNMPYGIATDTQLTKDFYVMNTDDIYLDYIENLDFSVNCRWLKVIEDYDNITAQYSTNCVDWYDASEYCEIVEGNYFSIYTYDFTEGSYFFRLIYNDKIYGNIVIDITENDLTASFIQGDIDGGDNLTQKLPTYSNKNVPYEDEIIENTTISSVDTTDTQSTAETTTELSTETTTVKYVEEEITPNKTSISGEKLIEAAKNQGDYITFEKEGIALELPSDFIESNNIKDTDKVSVEINNEKDKVKINVSVNNKPVENIQDSKLRLTDDTTELKDSNNSNIENISNATDYSEFPIEEVGTYLKLPEDSTTETEENSNKFQYIIAITIIIILGAGVVIYKWLNTQK